MAPHSSTLAWKIPWTEEPGGLQSMGSLELDTTERLHKRLSGRLSRMSLPPSFLPCWPPSFYLSLGKQLLKFQTKPKYHLLCEVSPGRASHALLW